MVQWVCKDVKYGCTGATRPCSLDQLIATGAESSSNILSFLFYSVILFYGRGSPKTLVDLQILKNISTQVVHCIYRVCTESLLFCLNNFVQGQWTIGWRVGTQLALAAKKGSKGKYWGRRRSKSNFWWMINGWRRDW